MAKDPAFLFYPGDFTTGTQFFSDEQVGKYMRILMAQHQHGHLTENQVLFICKSYDKDIMSKLEKDSAGLWFNRRLEIEIEKRKNYCQSRSANKNGKSISKNTSSSYDPHMENRDENRNELNNKKESQKAEIIYPFDSDYFLNKWSTWLEYRKQIGKPYRSHLAIQAALKNLSKHTEDIAVAMIEQSIANQWQGLFELKEPVKNGKNINFTPEGTLDRHRRYGA